MNRSIGVLKKFIIIGIGVFALLFAFNGGVNATDTASGLRVAPLRSELIVSAGSNKSVKVKLKNVTGGRVVIKNSVVDFTPNKDGSPHVLPQAEKTLATSIKPFITLVDGVELDADEEYEYELPVTVPVSASPGAYYGIILFQAVPAEQDDGGVGKVAITASIGHVVLLEVPGEVVEQLRVVSVKTARKSQPDSSKAPTVRFGTLFANPPNQIQIDIENTGNSFLKPFGNINIQNWRGEQQSSVEINTGDPKSNIIPSSSRTFVVPITEVKGIGRFTATANIAYGNGNEVVTVKSTFWVLPLWFVAVVAVSIVLVLFGIIKLVNKFRR